MRRCARTAALAAMLLVAVGCSDSTGADPATVSGTTEAGTSTSTSTNNPETTTRVKPDATTSPGVAMDPSATADPDGATDPGRAPLELTVLEADGLTLLVAPPGGPGGDSAQISGELVTDPGGCLALAREDSPPVLLVWPHGTEVETGARPQVDAPGVGVLSLGDRLEHAGGFTDRSTYDIPHHCLISTAREVAFLNAG